MMPVEMEGMGKGPTGLRAFAGILLGLTVAFTLMAGIGSSCVALGAGRWESMAPLVPYQWLYQILVVLTLIVGFFGIKETISFFKGTPRAYRGILIVLTAGALLAGIQMYASYQLRGGVAPNNMRLYLTLFTLCVFLLLRLPPLWKRLNPPHGGAKSSTPAGLTLILTGAFVALTTLWIGPSHMFDGVNWAAVLLVPLVVTGAGMMLAGCVLLLRAAVAGKTRPSGPKASAPTPAQ